MAEPDLGTFRINISRKEMYLEMCNMTNYLSVDSSSPVVSFCLDVYVV